MERRLQLPLSGKYFSAEVSDEDIGWYGRFRIQRAAVAACCRLIRHEKGSAIKVVGVYQPPVPMAAEPFAISAEYYQKLDQFAT